VPEDKQGDAAPAVLQFDPSGKFLQAWGWPLGGADQLWPRRAHCIYVDHHDNVWIGGTWREADESDDYLLKLSSTGKRLLQIGQPTASKGPRDTANVYGVADLFVYEETNELFAADEGNLRVIVYDADTGAFKRMWAGSGDEPPAEFKVVGNLGLRAPASPSAPGRAWSSMHAVRASNDGIVYAADRNGRRIQLFTLDGQYIKELTDVYASGLAFSRDPEQKFLYLADSSGKGVEQVVVMDRRTLTVLDRFGQAGTAPGEFQGVHQLAVDSKNDLYVVEVAPGNRLQKFVFKGLAPARQAAP
jgi:hypothetical protein